MVGIVNGYGLDDRGVRIRITVGSKNFLSSMLSRPDLGPAHSPIQWVQGVKRPEREVNHSTLTSAEVKKTWIYTCTPPYAFIE
jgi:hypothetical protein